MLLSSRPQTHGGVGSLPPCCICVVRAAKVISYDPANLKWFDSRRFPDEVPRQRLIQFGPDGLLFGPPQIDSVESGPYFLCRPYGPATWTAFPKRSRTVNPSVRVRALVNCGIDRFDSTSGSPVRVLASAVMVKKYFGRFQPRIDLFGIAEDNAIDWTEECPIETQACTELSGLSYSPRFRDSLFVSVISGNSSIVRMRFVRGSGVHHREDEKFTSASEDLASCSCLALSGEMDSVYAGGTDCVQSWKVSTASPALSFPFSGKSSSIVLLPESRKVVIGVDGGRVFTFDERRSATPLCDFLVSRRGRGSRAPLVIKRLTGYADWFASVQSGTIASWTSEGKKLRNLTHGMGTRYCDLCCWAIGTDPCGEAGLTGLASDEGSIELQIAFGLSLLRFQRGLVVVLNDRRLRTSVCLIMKESRPS